jgi:predicted dinucleotide-binding enzyme
LQVAAAMLPLDAETVMTDDDMMPGRRRFIAMAGGLAAASLAGSLPLIGRAADSTKIGVVGSGNVGSALGRAWAKAGHSVIFSSRHLEHDETLAADVGPNARAGTPEEAAQFGEVVLLAVPYRALPDLGKALAAQLRGKVVIDACNPFPSRDGDIANWARDKGAGLATAELLPGARIVRAFNAVGAARMGAAHETPGRFGMPFAGDDADANEIASRLIRDIGYEPILIGGLDEGGLLIPGSPLSGERPPEEVRKIAAGL